MRTSTFIRAPLLAVAMFLTVLTTADATIIHNQSMLGHLEQDLLETPSAGLGSSEVHSLVQRSTKSATSSANDAVFASAIRRRQHQSIHKRCKSKKGKSSSGSSSSSSSSSGSDSEKSSSSNNDVSFAKSSSSKSSGSKSSSSSDGNVSNTAGSGNYKRVEQNRGKTFWSGNNWDFFSHGDPTHGRVNYQTEENAKSKGLIGLTKNGAAYLRTSNKDIGGGNRDSVRFQTKKAYDSGLVIFDVQKMPVGCATWPALWTTQGANWPHGGEIDVMEGVGYTAGGKNANQMTVHLGENSPLQGLNRRALDKRASFTGRIMQGATNCNQWGEHTGCAFFDANKNGASWGEEFNAAGGGVWAMQFGNGGGIKIWFWSRGDKSLPKELSQPDESPNKLDPSKWGSPVANFQNNVINNVVKKQNIIINITIGGDWAGSVPMDGKCKGQDLNNAIKKGSNYDDAEFIINAVDVYCVNGKC